MTSARTHRPGRRGIGVLVAVALASLALGAGLVPPPGTAAPATGVPTATQVSTVQPGTQARAPRRANVVLVVADDLRADDLRVMERSRRLLGEQGATFTEALSQHPLCCPARAMLLSGRFAQNNGVFHNKTSVFGGYDRFDPRRTIATLLRGSQGYRTGFVGKHLNGYKASDGRDPGWTWFDPLVRGIYDYRDFGFLGGDRFRDDYVTTRIGKRAVRTLGRWSTGSSPFFVYVSHVAPHQRISPGASVLPPAERRYARAHRSAPLPAQGSPALNERDLDDKAADLRGGAPVDLTAATRLHRARLRSLRSVDDTVARIYATLRERGLLRSTYVVLTSDNGFQLGEHRRMGKNLLYDESVRVPLLVRGPGIRPGSTYDDQVGLLDLTATIAEWAGVPAERRAALDGVSLAPLLSGSTLDRDTVLIQTGRAVGSYAASPWAWRGVRTDRYTYATSWPDPERRMTPGNEVLFDRATDPAEVASVAGDPAYAAVLEALRSRLVDLDECAGIGCNRTFGPLPEPGA